MKVKSTGLGKTQLTAHIEGFYIKEDGSSAVMVIESTEPVHWHIECDMGGFDLRHFAGLVLRPKVIWSLARLLLSGGEAKGFVIEKEGGRAGRKSQRPERPAPGPATPPVASGAAQQAALVADAQASAAAGAGRTNGAGEPAPVALESTAAAPGAATSSPPLVRLETLRARSEGNGARSDREERRAERRRQREQAAEALAAERGEEHLVPAG